MDQLDSVCPIFCDKEGERLYQVGSGVLIDFRGHVFLLTAAHVIDELKNADLLIPHAHNEIKSVDGSYAYVKSIGSRDGDFLDYGYFKLDKDFSYGLNGLFYAVKEHELGVEKNYTKNELQDIHTENLMFLVVVQKQNSSHTVHITLVLPSTRNLVFLKTQIS